MPVYKDNDKFYFRTYYTDLNGSRKQYKSKRFSTKKQAHEEEAKFLLFYTGSRDNSLSFKEIYNSYCDFQKTQVRETTISSYTNKFKYLKSIENIKVKDFNLEQYNLWKNNLSKEKFSVTYKNNIFKFLKSLLKYANKYYDINNNIINKITGFKDIKIKEEMLFYTYEEFKKFISVENNINYKCFFETLYYCGLRLGEAQALKWRDINFKKREISISKTLISKLKGKKDLLYPPKTKNSIRVVPIPKCLLEDLKTLYNKKQKYLYFTQDFFVFGDITSLSATTIQKRKNENCKKSKVKQIRIHDFRHSCASLLISKGASPVLVSKYLGHSDIKMTLNTYSHLYDDELDKITKIINNL